MDRSLTRIDLNLLRTLSVLLEERSVTRTAQRLSITQPAVSKSLQRLRALLGDPLFVRTPHGLLPTPRAEGLALPLRATLEQLECYLIPPNFDPATVSGCLRIAAPEQFALGTISKLLMRLHRKAPNLRVESVHLVDDYLERLAAGTLDFAINLNQSYPEQFFAHPILSAIPMLWFRQKHPLARKKIIDLADMSAYPQIMAHARNATEKTNREYERYTSRVGLRRDVLLDTSHLLLAIDMLAKTDAVMMAPDYLASLSVLNGTIVQRPVSFAPMFDHLSINLSVVQHMRTLNSPLHSWIVGEIKDDVVTDTQEAGAPVERTSRAKRKR